MDSVNWLWVFYKKVLSCKSVYQMTGINVKHCKSAKLPWNHNIKLSFWSFYFVFLWFRLFVFLSFCHFAFFVFLPFCLSVFLSFWLSVLLSACFSSFVSFCLFVILSSCLFVFLSFLSFCLDLMLIKVWSLESHSFCWSSKVVLTDSLTHSLTKVRYRAGRAAKNLWKTLHDWDWSFLLPQTFQ